MHHIALNKNHQMNTEIHVHEVSLMVTILDLLAEKISTWLPSKSKVSTINQK